MTGEYISALDTSIVYSDELPGHIRAFATPSLDGGYTIVVNLKLNGESQRKAVEHELFHILSGDFNSELPVIYIEKSALEKRKPAPITSMDSD